MEKKWKEMKKELEGNGKKSTEMEYINEKKWKEMERNEGGKGNGEGNEKKWK